jgi:hypothetical protein
VSSIHLSSPFGILRFSDLAASIRFSKTICNSSIEYMRFCYQLGRDFSTTFGSGGLVASVLAHEVVEREGQSLFPLRILLSYSRPGRLVPPIEFFR